ncbi:hypothetical protein PHYBLDRAFT_139423 [Phycomyces blakesleeanus NRRL 1555(-)]|uniref:Uncharacterized protein n=1 Tax=Phycomyces blakesleeanus (strain ATCC 8743b / DSM 1359 / FGSC 10004 / NBRC 33097 / NRRL 1555) TaxID=763407 RepID=A0A162V1M9_PHYB8|nr:hypothetical protein PHYBLDRAFT_139423 [Phycomyces blakesleeanus NRRL 1555(-)]OAD79392.1 hypothetical protein PHYBLDRAFT_139423 [Phycomyces blakesleeanus NRRL 1555(-)]|eukprot:XP_018297432.1 hypothetical protein PHYBLDRAFT_139423 [Phycomyces blakesleeanus NRRL 1555(-)]
MSCPKKRSTIAKKINRSASSEAFIKKIQLENEDYVDLEFDHEDDIVLDNRKLQGISKEAPIELEESIDSELENIQIDKIAVLKLAHEDVKKEILSYTHTGPSSQSVDAFELCKLKSVECYLQYRISGAKTMEASEKALIEIWLHKNTYRPAAIRKRRSLFSDEDIKSTICKWIQNQRPESRSPIEVKKYIDGEILTRKLDISGNTSTKDVIAYHQKWAKRMMVYKKKMTTFSENEETVVLPVLRSDEIEHVLVTHNELTFYANDGKDNMWLMEDENPICKKDPGMSLIISEFKCICYGTMARGAWSSQEVFCPGANRDGYWMSADMLKQLKNNVIPLFELIHPECKDVFSFDQSTNHKVYDQNALILSKMNLNDKEIEDGNPCSLRNTIFVQNDVEKIKYVKDVRHILEELDLWLEKDLYNLIKKWRLDCKSKDTSEDSKCCAHHFLASQPDFMSQKTALHESVKGSDKNIHTFLDHAGKLPNIRQYYNHLWRYIEAYSQEMNVKEVNDVAVGH